jgi:hypothetical protein
MAKAYRLLRSIMNTAVDDGLIRRNPCRIKGASEEKTVGGVPAWVPGCRIEGDRLVAGRDADGLDPLFPFVGMAWLLASVEQQVTAKRAASALFVE